jgi:hypothetical protein
MVAQALTFIAVVIAWVFFRSPALDSAFSMLAAMMGLNGFALPTGFASYLSFMRPLTQSLGIEFTLGAGTQFVFTYLWVAVLFGIAFFLPNTQQFLARHESVPTTPDVALDAVTQTSDRACATDGILNWRHTRTWAILIGMMLAAGVLTLSSVTEFLYFQF